MNQISLNHCSGLREVENVLYEDHLLKSILHCNDLKCSKAH